MKDQEIQPHFFSEDLPDSVLARQILKDRCGWLLAHMFAWSLTVGASILIAFVLTYDTPLFPVIVMFGVALASIMLGRYYFAYRNQALIEKSPEKWIFLYQLGALLTVLVISLMVLYMMLEGSQFIRLAMTCLMCVLACINAALVSIQYTVALMNVLFFLGVPTFALIWIQDFSSLRVLGFSVLLMAGILNWVGTVGRSLNQAFKERRINQFLTLRAQRDRDSLRQALEELRRAEDALRQNNLMLEIRVKERTEALEREMSKTQLDVHEMQRLATTDALTGLVNRRMLEELLSHELQRGLRQGKNLAVIFIDLDKFKQINDTMGHAQGDVVLKVVADRLRSAVRASDTVARWGGDEFVVVAEEVGSTEQAGALGRKLIEILASPILETEQAAYVGGSLGVAFFPQDAQTVEALIHCADQAAYEAKREGGNTVCFFRTDLTVEAQTRKDRQDALNHAIESGQCTIRYQAVLGAETLGVIGFTAQPVWEDPQFGLYSGSELTKLAEGSGAEQRLLAWLFRKACEESLSANWGQAYPEARLIIPISERQANTVDLYKQAVETVKATGCSLNMLAIEVDGATINPENDRVMLAFFALRDLGIQVIQTEFGSGAMYLSHISRMPIDVVKIDQSLIDASGRTGVASAVMKLARQFHLQVWANGVATPSQLSLARDCGVDGYCGSLFGDSVQIEACFAAGEKALARLEEMLT